ncbi:MAG: hypothetical protein JNM36_07485 [Chitinophagales bacterium]|nr:hypothetical protein [Chitinophagales bacterium]HNI44390.1 hypothetical protein [Chitinophagales bacterium]HNL08006.1 hypothetical protein [Chitinophagales bacterium]
MTYNINTHLSIQTIWIAVIGLIYSSLAVAQEDSTVKHFRESLLPQTSAKWSVTSLTELKPYLQFGFERKIVDRLYFNCELGFGPDTDFNDNNPFQNYLGARTRLDIRWYFDPKDNKDIIAHGFIAPELLLKYEQWQQEKWIEQAGGAFAQETLVSYQKYVWGINVIAGCKFTPYKTPVTIDLLGGFGVKRKIVNSDPNANNFWNFFEGFDFNYSGHFPNLVFGVKLGYAID